MYNPDLSARRFTTSAINIVEQIFSRAAERGVISQVNEQTVVMLALWSLLRWERKVGLVALEQMSVEIDVLAGDVNEALDAACNEIRTRIGPPKLEKLPSGQLGITMDFNSKLAPLLAAAEHEAIELGHNWVGSEHLLMAIVRLAGPRLSETLKSHKIDYEVLRRAVLGILKS